MPSPYAPTNVSQLYRFVRFYAAYYKDGAGRKTAGAREKSENAERVRFNLETKIMPTMQGNRSLPELEPNHTVNPETFVKTLCGVIKENHMESRSDVQSFDYRTLILVEEKYPDIATYYLTADPRMLGSELVPETLRATSEKRTE
jgi:glycerophosphoryl diester phosphodiesterase